MIPHRIRRLVPRLALAAATAMAASLLAGAGAAMAQAVPTFHLDLDTGGHRAFVKDLAFTPDGDMLVSASDDKTIRVWDWRSGVTIRTIRGEVGAGNDGKVFALAVSPDGATVAAGGYFGEGFSSPPYGDVRLFDLRNGRMRTILSGLDFPVYGLDFSPDGTRLAAGGQDGMVRLWRQAGSADAWEDDVVLDAGSWHVTAVAFALDGRRLAAATLDNGILLWSLETGEAIAMPEAEPLRDTPLRAMAVSADGTLLATGNQHGLVQIWHAADGTLVRTLPGQDFLVGALSFSADGARLVVSCGYPCTDGEGTTVWSVAGGDEPLLRYGEHDSTIFAGASARDGTLVATAGGVRHEIHVWDVETGERQRLMRGVGEPVTSVGISADGTVIGWGGDNPCPGVVACPDRMAALETELMLPTRDRGFESPSPVGLSGAEFRRAELASGPWSLGIAEGGNENLANAILEVLRDGELRHAIENDATNGYLHGAFTFAGDGSVITGGNDGTMIAYDRETGAYLGEFLDGHTGELHAMAEAPDALRLVTGAADQTVRLWNMATRELVASMFLAGGEWIIWTPQGYYFSSPRGDELVGWHVNQGADLEARFVRARQLKQHLNSPEIVRRAILSGDPGGAARELRGTDRQLEQLLRRRPPEFEIRVADDIPAAEGYVAIEIVGAAEAGAELSSFTVMVNDRRIDEFGARSAGGADGDRVIIEVPVREGENDILITGINEYGFLTERGAQPIVTQTIGQRPKGKLYVVAVGVNEYPLLPSDCNGRPCDLRYPVADASEFVRVLAERARPLHEEMEVLLLVNGESLAADPARAGAIASIVPRDRLLEPDSRTISDEIVDFLDLPGPDDTTIVFVAGHGINVDEDYYFMPTDARKQDAERWRRSSLVDWSDIQRAMERARGRRFMLLDTCHAANAFNPRLEKDAADARIVVLSATAANNTALELAELGHGVFTHAVLEGLRGAANTSGDGVRILGLADYIYREVVRLTASRQEPFYHISQTENFLVAVP